MSNNENKTAAPRATNSATIAFGLVSLPVKLYTAVSEEKVGFKQISPRSKTPLKQKMWDTVENCEIERADILKGYEHAKDQFVIFTKEEVDSLEAEKSKTIDIVEFVPLSTIDSLYFSSSHYLGSDKGGDKAFALLTNAMETKGMVALGRWCARGKEQLVLIRPYEGGMMLHQLYFANEVRSNENIGSGTKFTFTPMEVDLAGKLVDQMATAKFAPSKYKDDYVDRVKAAVEKKLAGEDVVIVSSAPKASILDLAEALKRSLGATAIAPVVAPIVADPAPRALPAKRTPKKKAS